MRRLPLLIWVVLLSRVAHMLSMRTKTSFMLAMRFMGLFAIIPFVVLTMDQASRTTLKGVQNSYEFNPGNFCPSGIRTVFFHKDYMGVLKGTGFGDAAKLWPFSGSMVTQNAGKLVPAIGIVKSVAEDGSIGTFSYGGHVLIGWIKAAGGGWVHGPTSFITADLRECWWIATKWQVAMQHSLSAGTSMGLWYWFCKSLFLILLGTALFYVHALVIAPVIGGLKVLWFVVMAVVRRAACGFETGFGTPLYRKVAYTLFWWVFFGNLGLCNGVCQICHGFYSGCNGGSDGRTCKERAQVASNVAAVAAAGAISLVGLFNARILRVFTTTVLGLVSRYKAMPVAGTPYDFTGKKNSDVVADVTAGKVSKAEALVHFSKLIDVASELANDAGRVSKTQALEVQIKLLGAMEDKASCSSSSAPLVGVYRFLWAKCSEVVLVKDHSKVTVGGTEKESTSAQTAKIHTPDGAEAFLETLNLWQAMVVQTGLAPLMVVFEFTQRVVFMPMRRGDSWKLAHELLLVYIDKVDQSEDKSKNLANIFDKEGVDAMKDEALANVASRFGGGTGIFRRTGGARDEGGKASYNGKDSPKAPQPCMAWNRDPSSPLHRDEHLHPDGCCRFRHRCGQFIKLPSGEIGYCFRDHPMSKCDRKPEEKSDVGPAKKRV